MRKVTHGHTKGGPTKTYQCWVSMLKRCRNSAAVDYERYGGRGIRVCESWLAFENFLRDMGEKPDGLSLDRIDNDGHYEPDNCRWATPQQQTRNYSRNKMFTLGGETLCMKDWAIRFGLKQETLWRRLDRGWSIEKALTANKYARAK